MTLPASGTITSDMVITELRTTNPGRAYPLSLLDADVLALVGKSGPPVVLPGDFYGKTAGGGSTPPAPSPLTVQTQDGSGYASSETSGGTVSCQVSATVSGGTGTITHLWEFISNPGQFTLSNSNSATASVSRAYAKYSSGFAQAELRYTARDSAGSVVVVPSVLASLEWDGGQFA